MKSFRWFARSVSPAFLRRAAIRLAASTFVMATLNAVAHNEIDRPMAHGTFAACSDASVVPAEKGGRLCRRTVGGTLAKETLVAFARSAGASWLEPSPLSEGSPFTNGRWQPSIEKAAAVR
ncbi:hypothetical protein [Aureimonas psammosilenae]|uniref:hypothetical protein n=1 Tax=Aureimonas psammosilenae TaxID=2495496 RepID=UPI001260D230|nr:hypothetical protein [Aureimonas psammosilenae]